MAAPAQSLWRIAKHTVVYPATDLTGGGAKADGGRWNSQGVAVVYASTSIALATLETLAHLGDNIVIRNAFLVQISVPASLWRKREIIKAGDLPPTWVAEPPGSTTIEFGDEWLAGSSAALLLVPSVIVPEEHNVLFNPSHPDIADVAASVRRQFIADPRLYGIYRVA
jgi:RES domain-containing protein